MKIYKTEEFINEEGAELTVKTCLTDPTEVYYLFSVPRIQEAKDGYVYVPGLLEIKGATSLEDAFSKVNEQVTMYMRKLEEIVKQIRNPVVVANQLETEAVKNSKGLIYG